MKKVLFDLKVLNNLVKAINTKLLPRKYRINELPAAVNTVFSKDLEAARKELREFIYGPKYCFVDKYGLINSVGSKIFRGREDLRQIDLPSCRIVDTEGFANCYNLRSISMPNCVRLNIGAFYHCSSLKSIDFPNCTYLEGDAFAGCIGLEEVSGFSNVRSVYAAVFAGCVNLRFVSIGWQVIPWETFAGCEKLETVNLPNTRFLSDQAFMNCYNLTSISIPNVSSLTGQVFRNCTALEFISLPELVETGHYDSQDMTVYHGYNFQNCINLKSIYAPKYTNAAAGEFLDCHNLESIYMPALSSIPYQMFMNCSNLRTISSDMFSNVSMIYSSAFANCISLETAYFQNAILRHMICDSIFYNCTSLQTVKLLGDNGFSDTRSDYTSPSGIGSLAAVTVDAFYNCYNLESIEYPHAKLIENSAFYNCSKLHTVNFSECKVVYRHAFENCIALSSIAINDLRVIGVAAFKNCISLPSIVFSLCSVIGVEAFANCSSLSYAELNNLYLVSYSNTVSDSHYGVFKNCGLLKTAILPALESPTLIDVNNNVYQCSQNGMFENCLALENITLNSLYSIIPSRMFYNCQILSMIPSPNCEAVGGEAFANCYSLAFSNLSNCEQIYGSAFVSCSSLREIRLPKCSLIGANAFYNCVNLESIHLCSTGTPTDISCSIGSRCFYNCSNLRTIEIPYLASGIFYINNSAFANCISLESFQTNTSIRLDSYVFGNCYNLSTLSCSRAVIYGDFVFANCSALEEVHLAGIYNPSNKARAQAYGAFYNCNNLKRIYFYDFVPYISTCSTFYGCNFLEDGDLYVPSSLYDSFVQGSWNWGNAMAISRIHAF